jgi:hypothetical protein
VNKTIIMKDQARGDNSVIMTICKLLARSAWGKKVVQTNPDTEKEETVWQVVAEDLLYDECPVEPKEGEEPLINY